jgi:putative colanic acid biosynthesis UDP-glucose lipid carrier transferase
MTREELAYFSSRFPKLCNAGVFQQHSLLISRLHILSDFLFVSTPILLLYPPHPFAQSSRIAVITSFYLLSIAHILLSAPLYKTQRFSSASTILGLTLSLWFKYCCVFLICYLSVRDINSFNDLTPLLLVLLYLIASHLLVSFILRGARSNGVNTRTCLLVCKNESLEFFCSEILSSNHLGIRALSFFAPSQLASPVTSLPERVALFGTIQDLLILDTSTIQQLADFIVLSDEFEPQILDVLLTRLTLTTLPLFIAPCWLYPNMNPSFVQVTQRLSFLQPWHNHLHPRFSLSKRLFDIFLSIFFILLLLPLFILTALLVFLDDGMPILYRQQRAGLGGSTFTCYKFRSMCKDSPQEGFLTQATSSDPRVTRVGRIIRALSIDELPQFFNVLLGDMSIVGPRPHALSHNSHYSTLIPGYTYRLFSRPGITGLAQVSGLRGATPLVTDMEDRIKADLAYQRNWSLWLDLRIIIRTLYIIFKRNAY